VATTLISLSDTQMVTTFALVIPTLSVMACEISVYHYNLVCNLCLIATTSYITSAFIIYDKTKSQVQLGLRGIPVFVLTFLAWYIQYRSAPHEATGFPLFKPAVESKGKPSTGLVLPAICFLKHPNWRSFPDNPQGITSSQLWIEDLSASQGISTASNATKKDMAGFKNFSSNDFVDRGKNLTFLWLVGLTCFFSIFIYLVATRKLVNRAASRGLTRNDSDEPQDSKSSVPTETGGDGDQPQRRKRPVSVGLRIFFGALCWVFAVPTAIVNIVRFKQLQNWMLESDWFEDDGEKKVGTYGQFVPLILLMLPVISAIEAYLGTYFISISDSQMLGEAHGELLISVLSEYRIERKPQKAKPPIHRETLKWSPQAHADAVSWAHQNSQNRQHQSLLDPNHAAAAISV
jgi:hypothetical protein